MREHEVYLINPSKNAVNVNAHIANGMQGESHFGLRAAALSSAGLKKFQPIQSTITAQSPWLKYLTWTLPLLSDPVLLELYSIK